ncbi:MAG: ResB protein required for cytochrome C biosynthesis, partial [Opitutus sp.]
MNAVVRQFRNFFVSLRLTVVLLVLSMLLIFIATLDQVNLGIWTVQEKYFRSFFVLWKAREVPIPVFPGGYLIGGLLLINLVSAHVYRFKLSWRKAGIFLTHLGLILLLFGELLTGLVQEEYQMRLVEGETKNFSESYRYNELAIIETTDPKFDDVVVVPEEVLAKQDALQHPKLPFRVITKAYYPNAVLQLRSGAKEQTPQLATAGVGARL